jgi:hypothetical protein
MPANHSLMLAADVVSSSQICGWWLFVHIFDLAVESADQSPQAFEGDLFR